MCVCVCVCVCVCFWVLIGHCSCSQGLSFSGREFDEIIEEGITETRDKLKDVGPVDLLVNNAGVSTLQSFLEVTPEDYDKWVGR